MHVRIEEDDGAAEVQMAPLIDCVFLLLIFFLVATTLKKIEKELPLQLPDSAAAVKRRVEENLLIIGVDESGKLYLGAEAVSLDMLHRRLREAAARNPSQRVRVDGDRMTRFQDVVHILDLCQFEGLRNVGIHTRKEAERPGR
jgi:biopolymer transport protein ExbD